MGDSIHAGHRKRMRERFLKTGLQGFQEHEVLEFLLFYAIPRVDTNPLAHRLMERFGSLNAVLSASVPVLRSVAGMTENAAVYLRLIASVYALTPLCAEPSVPLRTRNEINTYFQRIYAFENQEILRLVCLDARGCLLRCHNLEVGTGSSVMSSMRKIVDWVMQDNSTQVLLAHNHPNGRAEVSAEDASSTRHLVNFLREISVTLCDHVIVGIDGVVSMRELGYF